MQPSIALVTGSARRIGAEIATALHAYGYDVIIHYFQSQTNAQELVRHLNTLRSDSAIAIKADLASMEETTFLAEKALLWKNSLSLLVNNASLFIKDSASLEENQKIWEILFRVNTQSPFMLSQLVKNALKKTHGAIINITDIHGSKSLKDYGIYCQSKAALNMQTKCLARELAPEVRVNAIAPGAIMWPENTNVLDLEIKEKIVQQTPLKKHGHPKYIAQAVLSLVENTFITGQILAVDGGRSLL